MATFEQLDRIARSLPEVTARLTADDRPEYRVREKAFVFLRPPRKDAVDPETGERMDDVLVFRTAGLEGKERLLADPALPLFTTPHFDGWPGVLLRLRHLGEVSEAALRELVVQAWLVQAPKRLGKAWLAGDQGPAAEG